MVHGTALTSAVGPHQENLQALVCPDTVCESVAELGHMQSHARVLLTSHQCCKSLVRSAKIVIFVEEKISYMCHRLASKNLWCFIGSLQGSCSGFHITLEL